jgi:hypothetical protein
MDWETFAIALTELSWPFEKKEPKEAPAFIESTIPGLFREAAWLLKIIPSPLPVAYIPHELADEETPEDAKGYYSVEFLVPIALELGNETEMNLIEVVAMANSQLPLPGFEWNSLTKELTYRYVWFFHALFFESTILLLILQAIQAALENYGALFQKVASGKVPLEEALKEWLGEMRKHLPE